MTVTRADTTTTPPATPYDFGDDDAGWEEKDRYYGNKPTKKPTKKPSSSYTGSNTSAPDGSGSAKLEAKCNASLDKFFAHEGISLCGKVGSWMRRTNGLIRQVHGHGKLCKDSDSTTTGYAADTTTYQPTTTTKERFSFFLLKFVTGSALIISGNASAILKNEFSVAGKDPDRFRS